MVSQCPTSSMSSFTVLVVGFWPGSATRPEPACLSGASPSFLWRRTTSLGILRGMDSSSSEFISPRGSPWKKSSVCEKRTKLSAPPELGILPAMGRTIWATFVGILVQLGTYVILSIFLAVVAYFSGFNFQNADMSSLEKLIFIVRASTKTKRK